jgi:SAM-dependent methyltransferase
MTWACERCVEVPVGRFYLDRFRDRRILEIGNVLSHYFPKRHAVLDKFEKGEGIINEDIVHFTPADRYDLVLSISTFEHIGFDDESSMPSDEKIRAALTACRKLLAPDGTLVITVPIGYNPHLDRLIREGTLGASHEVYFVREEFSAWRSADQAAALRRQYKRPFPYANAILVAEFTATG